jgi:hypothetical protein
MKIQLALFLATAALAQKPGDNAALRYWSAFAVMQQETVTPEKAKELNAVLEGSTPYRDLDYRDLIQRNQQALMLLGRGAQLNHCDWGIDYALGAEAPVDYVRKALGLGRLNVLSVFHLLQNGQRAAAVERLASGLRFSRQVAQGGPLFAALAAKSLIVTHLRAIAFAQKTEANGLTTQERASLLKAADASDIDWRDALRIEFDVALRPPTKEGSVLAAQYLEVLADPARLPALQRAIAAAPKALASRMPKPERVLDEQRDLASHRQRVRSLLGGR